MDGDFRSVDDSYYWAARMPDGAPALLSVTEDWDNLFDEDVVQEGNRPYVVDAYVWSTDIRWTGRETEGWLASGGGGYFTDCPSVRSIVYDLFGIDVLDESQARPVGPEWEGLLHAGESGDVGDVAYLNDSARFVRLCPGDAGGDASLPAGLARAIDRSAASREVEFFPSSYGMIPLVGDVSSTDVCEALRTSPTLRSVAEALADAGDDGAGDVDAASRLLSGGPGLWGRHLMLGIAAAAATESRRAQAARCVYPIDREMVRDWLVSDGRDPSDDDVEAVMVGLSDAVSRDEGLMALVDRRVYDLYDSVSSEVLDEGPSIPIDGVGGGRDARRDPLPERSVTR